ncbi:hypothetical protein ACFSHT_22510 [Paraburkholderia silviterrae]|uniref:Uncharacterized protein n=1 Tax=Paraburkholderia silviterrae TaxID=2528715 RepID=A0A4R5MG47_9BURK|nr:hypothetical protein [Paraburkholderia silviterrae]TDG25846.1 hypothetical protein EYW47_00300 [Paraburkholderia silviterrae]
MDIKIEFIPHKQHRFTTIGHWFVEDDTLTIQISREICWQNKVAVIFHELIEAAICIARNVTTEECDAFDELFEQEYDAGLWPRSVEAGFDKRCPYRLGHKWGTRFERFALWLMRANVKQCNEECDLLMGIIVRPITRMVP